MSVGVSNDGLLARAQMVGWQSVNCILRHRNRRGPGEIPWIDRVTAEEPAHIQLKHNRLRDVDWGEQRGQQVNLTNAAQVQQHTQRGV